MDFTPLDSVVMGGARILSLELLRYLPQVASRDQFYVLTTENNHQELVEFRARNLSIVPVTTRSNKTGELRSLIHQTLGKFFTWQQNRLLKKSYNYFRRAAITKGSAVIEGIYADLLFCPFTAPLYYKPGIPTISLIHDLQFLLYPHSLSRKELFYFREHFEDAWRLSTHIICVSDFVKKSVLDNAELSPEKISVIHNSSFSRFHDAGLAQGKKILDQYDLYKGQYMIYPAKEWPHKNHKILFEAFRLLKGKGLTDKLKLVCTGLGEKGLGNFKNNLLEFNLQNDVILTGFLPIEDLTIIFKSAKALIFPSLHEGFGMPIVEAFYLKVPVLCSDLVSLREVAGNAAHYFDAKEAVSIAKVVEEFDKNIMLQENLVNAGSLQLEKYYDSKTLAEKYYEIFVQKTKI